MKIEAIDDGLLKLPPSRFEPFAFYGSQWHGQQNYETNVNDMGWWLHYVATFHFLGLQ